MPTYSSKGSANVTVRSPFSVIGRAGFNTGAMAAQVLTTVNPASIGIQYESLINLNLMHLRGNCIVQTLVDLRISRIPNPAIFAGCEPLTMAGLQLDEQHCPVNSLLQSVSKPQV